MSKIRLNASNDTWTDVGIEDNILYRRDYQDVNKEWISELKSRPTGKNLRRVAVLPVVLVDQLVREYGKEILNNHKLLIKVLKEKNLDFFLG